MSVPLGQRGLRRPHEARQRAPAAARPRPTRRAGAGRAAAAAADGGAAAAADALLAPAYALAGRPGAPRLVGRRLQLNPFSGAADAVAARAAEADLRFAAVVDRRRWAPAAIAAAAAALGLGLCDPLRLLLAGLPQPLQSLLWRAAGVEVEGPLWAAAAAAAALPAAAYAARSWLVAQTALASAAAEAVPRLKALQGRPRAARAARVAAASRGLSWTIVALRAALLCVAAAGAASAAGSAAPQVATVAAAAAAAVGATVLAYLPQVLSAVGALAPEQQQQQQRRRRHAGAGAGAASFALEASWLLSAAAAAAAGSALALWPALAAASAALAAGSLLGLHRAVLLPRLAAVSAAAGDEALVQVRIRLDTARAPFDDTRDTLRSGLRVRVGRPAPGGGEGGGKGGGGEGVGGSAGVSRSGSSSALDALARSVGGALGPRALDAAAAMPGAHWRPLAPLIEAALPGALLGETVSIPFTNGAPAAPDAGGAEAGAPLYRSRALVWWQPLEDVTAKFGGRVPEAGEAFLYPVNPEGAWLWTAVRAVGTDHVELDANMGTEGQRLVMEAEVVEIVRGGR
ncbi:hypothetical protein Rsub_06532 [Raphidocelis subcapitata]|uniref:Uncharacterized protein n=1 Tax=Raphidocelis subcapitata TaxID=307507 RepID=A0A2V0P5Q5_9CHLO|nr:hypothetical protein Rsub_06532 [Raphidocelis subcapitata]|eukprot:GBF94262.1 hypothetical protein Rsub_06532 [Raphidocelis subcapitata]